MRSPPPIPNLSISAGTLLRKDSARMGSSAAREMLLSRMKSRMKLVNQVALTVLWHRTRNLPGTEMPWDAAREASDGVMAAWQRVMVKH